MAVQINIYKSRYSPDHKQISQIMETSTLYGMPGVVKSYLVVKTIVVKRLLRHPQPVIIIPYYKGTREQEIVESMLENYNPELVKTINFKEEIIL